MNVQDSVPIWYLENLNDEFVALIISLHCRAEDRRSGIVAGDGKKHDLYVCSRVLIEKLIRLAQQTSKLRYNLYFREQESAPLQCLNKATSEASPNAAAIRAAVGKEFSNHFEN